MGPRSGPNKCIAMLARRNRSHRNKWRFAIWAKHNRSYHNKWFKLTVLALLVPRVSAMMTTSTPPTTSPDGDGTDAYRLHETDAHRTESSVQKPPLSVPSSHHRELQTQVSTVDGLTSALANTEFGHIVLASGTYYLSATLDISRSVIIEAAVAGSVVLDAQGTRSSHRRVLKINSGDVQLIGLVIYRGHHIHGGGVYVYAGTVTFSSCTITGNTATVSAQAQISHRPDGKFADSLASTLAAQLTQLLLMLLSTTVGTCLRDLKLSHRPEGFSHMFCACACRAAV